MTNQAYSLAFVAALLAAPVFAGHQPVISGQQPSGSTNFTPEAGALSSTAVAESGAQGNGSGAAFGFAGPEVDAMNPGLVGGHVEVTYPDGSKVVIDQNGNIVGDGAAE